MKKVRPVRKKFLLGILLFLLLNALSVSIFFFLIIKPATEHSRKIVELIDQEILQEEFPSFSSFFQKVQDFEQHYSVCIELYDQNQNLLTRLHPEKSSFLISDIFSMDHEFYILKVYFPVKHSMRIIVLEYVFVQFFVLLLLTLFVSFFANRMLVNPIENIIQDIRNYKFGRKPLKRPVKNEIDLIQNEFVYLVESLESEKQEQNRIIASISHDLKTPLTSILGYSNLIAASKLKKEDLYKYNQKIVEKAENMKQILENFDDYLIHQGNQVLNLRIVLIQDLVTDLLNDYKVELEDLGIQFTVYTNLEKEYVEVDLAKMKRIFSNIIQNSTRYLGKNGKIWIEITKREDQIFFRIADNGPGVDEKIVNRIFDPLFTTDNSRTISGLGLSIVKEFVEMHGGSIRAYNQQGLTIEFTIPLGRRNLVE